MKIAALITAAALTCGTALAQSYGSTSDKPATSNHASATAHETQPKGEGFMDKTKRAFHRLGEKIRGAGHTAKNNTASDTDKTAQQSPDTRSMGAGADKSDSSRQARMDKAYGDSKKPKSTDK